MAVSALREFFSLTPAGNPRERQDDVFDGFTQALTTTHLTRWHGPRDVPANGSLLAVGLAISWNKYDQFLAVQLDEAVQDGRVLEDTIAVFAADRLKEHSDVEALLPGLHEPLQTPYIGWWRDGEQVLCDSGPSAMSFICNRYGLRVP
jgi:hypothetical protein